LTTPNQFGKVSHVPRIMVKKQRKN